MDVMIEPLSHDQQVRWQKEMLLDADVNTEAPCIDPLCENRAGCFEHDVPKFVAISSEKRYGYGVTEEEAMDDLEQCGWDVPIHEVN